MQKEKQNALIHNDRNSTPHFRALCYLLEAIAFMKLLCLCQCARHQPGGQTKGTSLFPFLR